MAEINDGSVGMVGSRGGSEHNSSGTGMVGSRQGSEHNSPNLTPTQASDSDSDDPVDYTGGNES